MALSYIFGKLVFLLWSETLDRKVALILHDWKEPVSLPWQLFSEVNISKWCLTILCMYNLFGVERMVVSNETQGNTTKCIVFKYSVPIFKVTRKPWFCGTAVGLWNYMPHEFLNCGVLSVKERNNIFNEIVANVQHHFILFGKAFWRTSELLVFITITQC